MINETFNLCTFQSSKIRNYSSDDSLEIEGNSREFKLPHTMERNAIKVKRLSRSQSKNLKLEMWDSNSNPKSPFLESDKAQKSPKDSNPWETPSGPTSSTFVDYQEVDVSKLALREVIARGSYGVTYLASYEGSDAAVKLLEWGEEDTMSRAHLSVLKKSFAQEAELWNQLSHPNLAKYKGAAIPEDGLMIPRLRKGKNGEIHLDGNACCIVLEHMPGGCLRDFLIRQSPKKLSVRQRMKLALDVASGLAYLHSKGITHYAIKSENLMMDKKGVVKIADFGSGSKGSVSYYESSSSNGMDISSIAPEVIKGARYTEKSDVYAFGFCLFEIFLCNIPLSDKLIHEGLLSQKAPKVPSYFPQKLTGILANCWETSPHNRPSMKDVLAYLKFVSQEMDKSRGLLKYIRNLRPFS